MSRIGITYEEVELAIEKILGEGSTPTIEKVRLALGSTGSNSTIAKHLADWKSKRLSATRHDLPTTTLAPDPVNAAVNRVWQQIREESAKEIEAIKTQFSDELSALQSQLTQALNDNKNLLAHKNELQSKLAASEGKHELLAIDLRQSQQDSLLLQEREQGLQAQLQQNEMQSNRMLAELKLTQERELKNSLSQQQKLEAKHAAFISDLKEMQEAERHRYMTLLDQARTKIAEESTHNKALRERVSQLETELHSAKTAYDKLQLEWKKLQEWQHNSKQTLTEMTQTFQKQVSQLQKIQENSTVVLKQQQQEIMAEIVKQRNNRQQFEEKLNKQLATWTKAVCKKTQ